VKAKVDLVNIKENIKEYLTLKKHRLSENLGKKININIPPTNDE
jgi:hypothetical protein